MTKSIYVIIFLSIALVFFIFLAIRGLDKIETQRQKIVRLETKVMWLQNVPDEYMLAIEAMPEMERDELKAVNELIKQGK